MDSDEDKLSSLSDYAVKTISVYGVPENFMSVIDNKYYIEEDVQDVGDSLGRLGDGQIDPVALLYSDEGYDPYPCKDSNDTDCFKIAVNDAAWSLKNEFVGKPAWTLKMLLPAGAKDLFAVEPGDIMKFSSNLLS